MISEPVTNDLGQQPGAGDDAGSVAAALQRQLAAALRSALRPASYVEMLRP